MPTITTEAGPWNMTVYAFEADDPENPLGRVGFDAAARLPYGAAELDRDGRVSSYTDTEPDSAAGLRPDIAGRNFFGDVAGWAGGSAIEDCFRGGVEAQRMNTVFDCAVRGLPYRVRIHLKISPILGTYWIFIKKLQKGA